MSVPIHVYDRLVEHRLGTGFPARSCKHRWELKSTGTKDVWDYRCDLCGYTKREKVKQEEIRLVEE